jgi:hypothetical protein
MTVAKRNKREQPDAELVKLADSLLANYQKPEDLIGENGLLKQLTRMLVERALETEMSEHLGHGKGETVTNATGNTRNGHSAKTLQGEFGELPLNIPRDRQGAFEPKLVERSGATCASLSGRLRASGQVPVFTSRPIHSVCLPALSGYPIFWSTALL